MHRNNFPIKKLLFSGIEFSGKCNLLVIFSSSIHNWVKLKKGKEYDLNFRIDLAKIDKIIDKRG